MTHQDPYDPVPAKSLVSFPSTLLNIPFVIVILSHILFSTFVMCCFCLFCSISFYHSSNIRLMHLPFDWSPKSTCTCLSLFENAFSCSVILDFLFSFQLDGTLRKARGCVFHLQSQPPKQSALHSRRSWHVNCEKMLKYSFIMQPENESAGQDSVFRKGVDAF